MAIIGQRDPEGRGTIIKKRNRDISEHKRLCDLAKKWLLKKGCMLAFTDCRSIYCAEEPDALGVKNADIWTVECKTSVEDFLRDEKKSWRAKQSPVGNKIFYLMTHKLCQKIFDKVESFQPSLTHNVILVDVPNSKKMFVENIVWKYDNPLVGVCKNNNKRGAIAILSAEMKRLLVGKNRNIETKE